MPAAPELAPTTDLTDAYPEWRELRAALRREDWPTARRLITDQPPSVQTQLIWQVDDVRPWPGLPGADARRRLSHRRR